MKRKIKAFETIIILAMFVSSVFLPAKITAYANNLPSLICIDSPQNNSMQSNSQISISGWSLNAQGVQKVQIYVDGAYRQDATTRISRPDVDKVYPGYTGGTTSGYSTNLDISSLSVGAHTVTVKSVGNDGSITTQDVQVYKVPSNGKNMSSLLCVDTPQNNSKVASLNNQLTVSGWSLDGYGVQKVQVYVDGTYKQDATIGVSRPDVNNVYPGYVGGTTSGYSTNLDISSLSGGVHTITVKSIGNDGQVQSKNVNVNKVTAQTMPARVCVDTPNNLKTSSNQITVSGWALDLYGVQKVQVYVDGTYKQDATTGISRPDVNNVYPGYAGGTASGYSTNLDISSLSVGSHTVTVKGVGNDGNVTSQDEQIYKIPSDGKNMSSLICVDTPQNSSNVASLNNQLTVSGWSLDGYGVQKVQVYLDGNYKGNATSGTTRPDVNKIYPQYVNSSSSGYNYNLDISSISDGVHTITVKSVGNDGQVQSQNVNVNKVSSQTMPEKICVDAPNSLQTNSGQITVSGWSLDVYGVQKVQVYVDGTYKQDASIGISRPDVNNVYPGYTGGGTSGYSTNLDISSLSTGVHTITVNSIGNDGSKTSENAYIYKLANGVSVMPSRICVDAPSDGTFYKNQPGQVTVKGWSLDVFGIKKVQVYFDNNYSGDATIGISRTDVNNVYPGYTNGVNSGFSYNLNLSNISDGVHTITVNSIGNGGGVTTQNIKIYKFSFNGQTTLYNVSLQGMVNAQMNYGQPVTESGYSWVGADRNTVQYYVDPMNFMDNYGVYQFLRLDYMQGVTAADLNNILAGKGVLAGKGADFLAAAQQSNVNPVYLVSHALLETANGTSTLATGVSVNGRATYNLFGIGAYDSNPITMGARYAYNQGWFSVNDAIYGGAKWISADYINNSSYKQNTLYKMRWNPASPANHQYATDVRWAYNQIYNIKKLINMVQNPVLQFDVPRYN
ncbi:MAG: Ig-like domain-containing protein [Clostridium sp.]|nr:Ig-like domain-containing protein [Clostridium sp.]